MNAPQHKYPEILADIAAMLREFHLGRGLPPEEAEKLAYDEAEVLRQHLGGQFIYFPMGVGYDALKRHHEIWTKYNGKNVPALAAEYQISEVYVYTIIRRMRELERAKKQTNLDF